MNLKEILATKRVSSLEAPVMEEDCFLLTDSSEGNADAAMRVFFHLVNVGHSKANLLANDCAGLRTLEAWLAPFPISHLPYNDKIPRLLQSFTLWQLGKITGIPPARFWPILFEVIIEAEKISLDKKSQFC